MRGRLGPALVVTLTGLAALALVSRPTDPDDTASPDPDPAALDGASRSIQLRTLAKGLAADDAAAGRLSLVEAAAVFAALDRLPPAPAPDPYLKFRTRGRHLPDDTPEERLCLQVIGYVHADDAEGGPPAATVRRLEEEFAAELRRHGVIRVTDPPPGAVVQYLDRALAELARSRGDQSGR
ncbi:MAG TPA: hypothetical protein VGF55_10205 [Gemmataceae bacterium]|jgi:hypothetical protein